MKGPYLPQEDLTGAEVDTLCKLASNWPAVVDPGDLPSKVGCAGLVKRGLAAYMAGGSAVCIDAGLLEYFRRNRGYPQSPVHPDGALCGECGGNGVLANDGPYSLCSDCGGVGWHAPEQSGGAE